MSEAGYMRLSIRCPHCLEKATAEDSQELSRTVREVAYRCRNYRCGHVYVARLEVVRTLEPSRMPSPLVSLPLSLHVRRAPVQAALLTIETEANDEADYLAQVGQPLADWGGAAPAAGLLWAADEAGADAAEDAAERARYCYITIRCPHCAANAIAVASRELSRTLREVTYRCRNHRCRHAYVAQLGLVRTLSLSSTPCADVVLPISPHVRLEQLQALLKASPKAPPA
ncbi:ogr/Delta-like zinc finger family protein [Pseudacidovorax intermedius]|uniref:ogr/Delta-like zinc finger family protein n=1 Tax=Pseudacidovorax intermedius TaxID=433924 RepID=UPI001FA7FCA9|nr:ogr/Delta-like zinc finger family protein [Pseudacidovorax intermedius]